MRFRDVGIALTVGTGVSCFVFAGWFVYILFQPETYQYKETCAVEPTEQQLKDAVIEEMVGRKVIPSRLNVSYLKKYQVGKFIVRINRIYEPDPKNESYNEYTASKYEVNFSEGDFSFWALVSPCGTVNIAYKDLNFRKESE